jgi:hypothetical protein
MIVRRRVCAADASGCWEDPATCLVGARFGERGRAVNATLRRHSHMAVGVRSLLGSCGACEGGAVARASRMNRDIAGLTL